MPFCPGAWQTERRSAAARAIYNLPINAIHTRGMVGALPLCLDPVLPLCLDPALPAYL